MQLHCFSWSRLATVSLLLLTPAISSALTAQQGVIGGGLLISKPWSNPTTWPGNSVPVDGDHVVIPANKLIELDVPTARLASLTIHGRLEAKRIRNLEITSDLIDIMDGGVLRFGTKALPFVQAAEITLTGPWTQGTPRATDNGLDNPGNVRALRVHNGGSLLLFGKVPELVHTTLATPLDGSNVQSGNMLQVAGNLTGWRQGHEIAVGPTDFYGVGGTARHTLFAHSNGSTLSLTGTLQPPRFSVLQYPMDTVDLSGSKPTSMTTDALATFTPPVGFTPKDLDERAPVVHLTRSITIRSGEDPNSSDDWWASEGFGAHVMIHGPTSEADPVRSKCRLLGVSFEKCGQRRFMGRYPLHWHMLSYQNDDNLGDATQKVVSGDNHYVHKCSIVGSSNRAIVVHGTCGVEVHDNVAVDVVGHAYFLEDGSEEENSILRNVAMMVRPGEIKVHDADAAGFWITNPNNEVVDNRACDAQIGLWNSFSQNVFGVSAMRMVNISPITTTMPANFHRGNIAHSNRLQGIVTGRTVKDESGAEEQDFELNKFNPAPDGSFELKNNSVWKNGDDGYHNRAVAPQYSGWVVADNDGVDFFGATDAGAIRDVLFVAYSLNNTTDFPSGQPRRGAASYHYAIAIENVAAVNYVATAPELTANFQFLRGGGFLDSSDLYLFGVAKGGVKNKHWGFYNSSPGFLNPSPVFDGFALEGDASGDGNLDSYRYFSLAGAIHDPYGYWSDANRYLVPDHPFYRGLASVDPFTEERISQDGVSPTEPLDFIATETRYFGIEDFRPTPNGSKYVGDTMAIRCTRLAPQGNPLGTHDIPEQISGLYVVFRFFALANGGHYCIEFPDIEPAPDEEVSFKITNTGSDADPVAGTHQGDVPDPSHSFVIAIPWRGPTVSGFLRSGSPEETNPNFIALSEFNDQGVKMTKQEVLNDPTGSKVFFEFDTKLVWYRFTSVLSGGSTCSGPFSDPNSDSCHLNPQYLTLRQ